MIVPDLSRVLGTEILGESRHVPLQTLYIVQRSNMETSPSISIINHFQVSRSVMYQPP